MTTTTTTTAADAAASTEWPAGALAAAEQAFRFLTVPPAPLALDGRALGHGLPARHIPLDELRRLLVHDPDTTFAAKDAAWHQLVDHARGWGPSWVVATVGMALPALTTMARRLCAGHHDQTDDIESELLAGFLDALRHKHLSGPAPYARMCWAGWRAALLVRRNIATEELPELFDPTSRLPTRPYGHPDLILGRAVHAGVINADQAELISATRLGRVLVEDLAAKAGVDASVIRMRRRRAELAVVRALTDGVLSGVASLQRRGEAGPGQRSEAQRVFDPATRES
jgi:hypothetical protein